MNRTEKSEAIEDLKEVFDDAGVVILAHYAGLTVAEMSKFRAKLRETSGVLKVIKNRLAKIALDQRAGEAASALFTGPTAIIFAKDPVAVSKIALDYAKENDKLVLRGAILGETLLNVDGIKSLSTLPSLDEMRARLIGMITQPATKIASVLTQPGAGLARVINAYATKDQDAA